MAWDFNSWKQLGSLTVPQSLNVFTGTPLYSAVSSGQNVFVCLHNETDGSSDGCAEVSEISNSSLWLNLITRSPNAAVVLHFSLSNNAQPQLVSDAPWSPSDNTASAPVAEASDSYVIFASSVFPAPGKPSVEIDIYSYA